MHAIRKIFVPFGFFKKIAHVNVDFGLLLGGLRVFFSRARVIPALLLTLTGTFAFAEGNIAAGQAAFHLCVQCHQVGPSARSGFAPQLNGIVGRPAAAVTDYRYSKAMKNSGVVWTEEKLRAFLRDPDDVVPGTSMRFWGIRDQQKISDLLAYLRMFPVKSTP